MTVSNKIPSITYTGDGTITKFDWDWDTIEDSSIHVRVNDINVTNWTLEGNSVIFDTAPADGDDILIFRRTKIWMPEDYRAFGRFAADKTELSVDRAIMIAQDKGGDRGNGNAPNGVVGGADLSITRGEYSITVNNERGTDAVVPMWSPEITVTPGTPDPAIIWAGDDILTQRFATSGQAQASIVFNMVTATGDPAEASARYDQWDDFAYVGWLNTAAADNTWWFRVTVLVEPEDGYVSVTNNKVPMILGQPFLAERRILVPGVLEVGPFIIVYGGVTPPDTASAEVYIEICKDNGSGLPDEQWVGRVVKMEAITGV